LHVKNIFDTNFSGREKPNKNENNFSPSFFTSRVISAIFTVWRLGLVF